MLETQLRALKYPSAASFDASDGASAFSLVAWLEDHHIRQLPLNDRGALRSGDTAAVAAYLGEMAAPAELLAALSERRYAPVCAWLVGVALQYEYGENAQKYDDVAAAAAAPSGSGSGGGGGLLLAPDDQDLLGLAAALGVTPSATDAVQTLNAVIVAVRKRPRPRAAPTGAAAAAAAAAARPAAAAASGAASVGERGGGARKPPPLAPLGAETFPLGFETGSGGVDEVSRVLRMLYVRELRRLQDRVNEVVVGMQEFTANPNVDASKGRVGR